MAKKEEIKEQEAAEENREETGSPAEESAAESADASDLQRTVEELKEEIASLVDNLQRERAEFMNFRKRTLLEKEELTGANVSRIMNDLLPGLDAFDQLFAGRESMIAKGDVESFFNGAELIRKQILEAVGKYGVEEFSPENQEFDPNTMEALSMSESADVKTATVGQVYQKGYRIGGRLVRAARVNVLNPAVKEEKKEGGE